VNLAKVPTLPSGLTHLALEAGRGDARATTELLRALSPEIARVVRGVLGPNAADVDDALQQSLVGLVHALPAFRAECSPAGYACRIGFRTALAVRKAAHRRRARHDDSVELDEVTSAHAQECDPKRTELLRQLLDEIPEEQAEALTMRVVLGWSLEEIAESSGAPLNTVRSRLRLAKEALRARIESVPALYDALQVTP
jgi:RNA polymerase sigma factor (sigma-70 family)